MTKDEAKALFENGFWEEMTAADRVKFQLFEDKLCMPFDVFQQATQETLGRPVWTHEFADPESLRKELLGEQPAPTFEEILALIPEEKRLLVMVDDEAPSA